MADEITLSASMKLENGSLKVAVLEIIGLVDNARSALAAYEDAEPEPELVDAF